MRRFNRKYRKLFESALTRRQVRKLLRKRSRTVIVAESRIQNVGILKAYNPGVSLWL
jgi:hypothetical protein